MRPLHPCFQRPQDTAIIRRVLGLTMVALVVAMIPIRRAEASPFGISPLGDESFAEKYVAIAHLDDDTYLKVQLWVSNVGMGDGKGACQVMVAEPGHKPWQHEDKVGGGEWKTVTEPYPGFQVGSCYIRGGNSIEVFAGLGGTKLRLNFAASPSKTVPPGHPVYKDKKDGAFHQLDVTVPFAPVRASYVSKYGGKKVVSGVGYIDHTRSTTMPSDIARRWVRVRAFDLGKSVLILGRYPPKSGGARGWVWVEGSKPVRLEKMNLAPLTDGKKGWRIEATAAGKTFVTQTRELIQRDAPVERMSMSGLVKSIVGNPVTYLYRGDSTAGEHQTKSIVEITNTNE